MEKLPKDLILLILGYLPNKFNNKFLLNYNINDKTEYLKETSRLTKYVLKERSFPQFEIKNDIHKMIVRQGINLEQFEKFKKEKKYENKDLGNIKYNGEYIFDFSVEFKLILHTEFSTNTLYSDTMEEYSDDYDENGEYRDDYDENIKKIKIFGAEVNIWKNFSTFLKNDGEVFSEDIYNDYSDINVVFKNNLLTVYTSINRTTILLNNKSKHQLAKQIDGLLEDILLLVNFVISIKK